MRAHRQQMPARLIKSLRPSSLPRHVCEDQEKQFPTPSCDHNLPAAGHKVLPVSPEEVLSLDNTASRHPDSPGTWRVAADARRSLYSLLSPAYLPGFDSAILLTLRLSAVTVTVAILYVRAFSVLSGGGDKGRIWGEVVTCR